MNIDQNTLEKTNKTSFSGGLCHASVVKILGLSISILAGTVLTHGKMANADVGATHDALISEFASFNTPGVVDGRVEAIAIDGDTVYVGGTFTQITNPLDDQIIDQAYLFAYSKSTGDILLDFDPVLNNSVLALETTGDAEGGVFAGGTFGNLNGEFSRGRFAKIDINGDRVSGFGARVNASVKSMVRLDDTLYIGGTFSSISGAPIERLAALDTSTGALSADLNLDFDGVLTTSTIDQDEAVQSVDDMDITSDGRVMVIVGNFSSINGASRPRLALLELDGQASVSSWNTDVFDVQCPASIFPQYIQGIDISPDDSYLITGSNGFRFVADPACDSIARYEIDDLTNTNVQPTWVNYTGGDSVYEVVATDHAVYTGGHFRWLNNDTGNDSQGAGSIARAGLAALDPLNGLTLTNWQSDRNPRGVGVFAMIAEPEGLYIGDDTDFLNGTEHRKLKFLPVSDDTIARPSIPTLPTTLLTRDGFDLDTTSFDGTTFDEREVLGSADWIDTRGAVFVGGTLFHADAYNNLWMSDLVDGVFEPRVEVETYGLTYNEWQISQMGGMFFNHEWGRLYYTKQFDSRLFWRAFTPASPYFGNDEYVADSQTDIPWSSIRGMDVIDGYLYYVLNDDRLYRAQMDGVDIVSGTVEAIGGPDIDGREWDEGGIFFTFINEDTQLISENVAEIQFESSGSDSFRRFQSFEFPIQAGDEIVLRLSWDDPSAQLSIFLRNTNDEQIARDNSSAGSPKFVTATADVTGTYTASVLISEGSTSYTLQVNPTEEPPAEPEPLADYEFSSNGSPTEGRWQVFNFDVVAGETVDAEVIWNDPAADVRVFLRDESGSQVDRFNDGTGTSINLSAVAQNSGRWSVAVRIQSGTVDYDVLVNSN